jgi:hypothetical protein
MSAIPGVRSTIQQEETASGAALSESTLTRLGAAVNFINDKQYNEFLFGALGPYGDGLAPYVPVAGFGGSEGFLFASEIVDIIFTSRLAGVFGTNNFDIKWAAAGSGTWATIFSTTPKATAFATTDAEWKLSDLTSVPSGITNGVLSKTTFAAGDRLRLEVLSVSTGANDFLLRMLHRPI